MSQNVIEQNIIDILTNNYMPYTAYVIMERALPEIDGFKPSQRRILYTMLKMGLLKGNRKKSQGVVGTTMFLHPHGDASIYETLVRMSKDAEALLFPFIDSKGNFGKQYSRDMQYGAMRYTEVRLTQIAKELFTDIDKNTVEMVDNYDGTLKEPRLLPVTFPNILVNPQTGIANGMASNIASFNLNEIIDLTIAYIKNPKINVTDFIKAPDFSTGGCIIYDEATLNKILETGRGSFNIRATYRFEKNSIIFEELPYTSTYEAIIDKISQLVKEGKLKEIVDIDNLYGFNSKGIEVTVKNNTDKKLLVEKLFKLTPLQSSFSCNFNIITNGRPKVLGVKQIVHEWLAFRANAIKRGATFEKTKKENKKHLLTALKQVMLDIDKAIKIIRETKKNNEVIANLMKAFNIDELQAEFVAEIKLRHLNKEYLLQRIDEIKVLEKEIAELEDLIINKITLAKLIIKQLIEVKNTYGQERKSQIISIEELPEIEQEEITIDNYNVKVYVTEAGYLKKIPLTSLRGNYEIKVKDGDRIINEFDTTNNSDVLVFVSENDGSNNIYKLKSYDLEDMKPSSLGDFLPSLLGLSESDKILYVCVSKDYSETMLIGFENGKLSKIDFKSYYTSNNRKKLKNGFNIISKPIFFKMINEDLDLVAVSDINKIILINTSFINKTLSKSSSGVQFQKSKDNSKTIGFYELANCNFSDTGYYRNKSAGIGKYLLKTDKVIGDVINGELEKS